VNINVLIASPWSQKWALAGAKDVSRCVNMESTDSAKNGEIQ
jgi:hypothetical protein